MTAPYENYKIALEYVRSVQNQQASTVTDGKSDYWREEVDRMDYMLDATPKIIEKLRHHCHLITGIRPYEYRTNRVEIESYKSEIERLTRLGGSELIVPESRFLGGFGHEINGALYNYDTLKFSRCLISMKLSGVLDELKSADNKTVVEIGAGWGGFAYQFKQILPDSRYVIVDLPEILLFSITYLTSVYPDAKVLMYSNNNEIISDNKYDFVFIPSTLFQQIEGIKPHVAVNIVSFQEMTSVQVDDYIRKLDRLGTKILYSMNRDRQQSNNQLGNLRSVVERHYKAFEFPFPGHDDNTKLKSTYSHKHLFATNDACYIRMLREQTDESSCVNNVKSNVYGKIAVLIICDDGPKKIFRILDDINRDPDEGVNIVVVLPNNVERLHIDNLKDYSKRFQNVKVSLVDESFVKDENNIQHALVPKFENGYCYECKHALIIRTSNNEHAAWVRSLLKRLGKIGLSGNFVYKEIKK